MTESDKQFGDVRRKLHEMIDEAFDEMPLGTAPISVVLDSLVRGQKTVQVGAELKKLDDQLGEQAAMPIILKMAELGALPDLSEAEVRELGSPTKVACTLIEMGMASTLLVLILGTVDLSRMIANNGLKGQLGRFRDSFRVALTTKKTPSPGQYL